MESNSDNAGEDAIQQDTGQTSFYGLFAVNGWDIVIPIIQRDYAQGREDEKSSEIRGNFLDALFRYLEDGEGELDFIYGSIVKGKFIPLDGQQRLTTLFLLHCYLRMTSGDQKLVEEFTANLVKNGHSRFTYHTRQSAAEFCDGLITHRLDLEKPGLAKVSTEIKNQPWFFRNWTYDPTIVGMLVTLDAIHERYKKADPEARKDYFRRLLDLESPSVSFMYLNLQKFGLTEDLYIKMNSRGRQLTKFENFKSGYENFLKELNPDRKFTMVFQGEAKEVSLREYFSHSIDTRWLNMIWQFRDMSGDYGCFDALLSDLIRVLFTYEYALRDNADPDTLEQLRASNRYDRTIPISYLRYVELGVLTEKSALQLVDWLDAIYRRLGENGEQALDLPLPYNESQVFKNALQNNFTTYGERVAFYAWLQFLKAYGNDPALSDWMRVIFNLTNSDNQIIDEQPQFIAALRAVDALLPQAKSILEYLARDAQNKDITFFHSWLVLEEKIKSCLLLKNDVWRKAIIQAELHGYFIGQICFLLEFAGIVAYYLTNRNCDWPDSEDSGRLSKFMEYYKKADAIFKEDYANRVNDEDYCFERAVMTKGDYIWSGGERWDLLSTNAVRNNVYRDHSWRRLLRYTDGKSKDDAAKQRLLVKAVLDDKRFDPEKPVESLKKICADGSSTMYLDVLIKNPKVIEASWQGFVYASQDRNVFLILRQSRLFHYHVELYTYDLWTAALEDKTYQKLVDGEYHYSKSSDDDSYIYYRARCGHRLYELYISACLKERKKDLSLDVFEIEFRHNKYKSKEDFEPKLVEHLENWGFEWNDEHEEFICEKKTRKEVEDLLDNLDAVLSD